VERLDAVTKFAKYVNMADVIFERPSPTGADQRLGKDFSYDLIELLFFAYRDFVGDADEVLAGLAFGRAHHRVLHFVSRNPGMKVAQLLELLKITKQSLGRVLKPLIDDGYVEQRAGPKDRRQRLLFVTAHGEALVLRLAGLQNARIGRALVEIGPKNRDLVRHFLLAMLEPERREGVLRLIERTGQPRRRCA
jgi:DNA-binding MarR family transcriptional regulator